MGTLAQALLEKGERDVVLEYLKPEVFWELRREILSSWAAMVKRGEKPNFGATLLYGTSIQIPSSTN